VIFSFVNDLYRFVLSYKIGIELAPLQVYTSALFFSPISSIVKQTYAETEGPKWVTTKSEMQPDWSACLQSFEGHKKEVKALAFSPNGAHLASWSDDAGKIWDLETGACLHTFMSNGEGRYRVVYSPHGKHLAVASYHTVQLWDVTTLACLYTFQKEFSIPTGLVFSLDCTWLAVSGYNFLEPSQVDIYSVQSWDLGTGTELETHDFDTDICYGTAFTKAGAHLALIAEKNGTNIRVRNLTTNWHPPALDIKHNTRAGGLGSAVFSANAAWLALETPSDETIRIFDCLTGACLQTISHHSSTLSFLEYSIDCTKLLSISQNGCIQVWDPVTGTCLKQLYVGSDKSHRALGLTARSPDCILLAEAWERKEIRIWDMTIGTVLQTHRVIQTPRDDENGIRAAVFLADNAPLVTALRSSGLVETWDPATGACIKQIGELDSTYMSMVFFPDGKRLALGGYMEIAIWDTSSAVHLQTINIDRESSISSIAISSAGNLIAAKYYLKSDITIWDLATNAILREISFSEISPYTRESALVFSSDDTKLGVTIDNGTVLIYDVDTGTLLQNLNNLYDAGHGSHTALYNFDLNNLMRDPLTKRDQDSNHRFKLSTFSISSGGTWILRGQERVLWLPVEYRPYVIAVYDCFFVIGRDREQFLCLQFDIGELDKELAGNAVAIA
jgi:WD40 repeat protein